MLMDAKTDGYMDIYIKGMLIQANKKTSRNRRMCCQAARGNWLLILGSELAAPGTNTSAPVCNH